MTPYTYEIRTMSGRPVLRFDDEARARAWLTKRCRQINTRLRLMRITQIEEEIAA